MCDAEWQRIRSLTKAENNEVFIALKKGYRTRLLPKFGPEEMKASKQVFTILAQQGGRDLVGKATTLAEETFWQTNRVNLSLTKKLAEETTKNNSICELK